ncbi:MAG: transporter substrate-binding protein [Bacilli bacterium]|nr:transporter substrate-binding protein [Bacilli bacterium]
MKLKKSLAVSILAAMVVLAGCGGTKATTGTASDTPSATTGAATTAPTPAEKVSLTIQVGPPDKTVENAEIDKKIARFNEKFPNVVIKKDDWKYESTQIGVKMASRTVQSEFSAYATDGKTLASHKWAADITDILSKWQHTKELNNVILSSFVVNGKNYGVPNDAYAMTITINKKIFKDKGVALPPYDWTFDDLINAAKAVNDPAKGIAGFVPMGKGNEAGWNWTNFLYSAGGAAQKVENGKVTSTLNTDAGLKALEFYKKLKDANVIPKNWSLGYGDAVAAFNTGRGAMVMTGSGEAVQAAINDGGMKAEDLAIYPIPSFEKGGKHIGVLGGDSYVISPLASPQEQQAAFDWVTFDYFNDTDITRVESEIKAKKEVKQMYIPKLMNYWMDNSDYGNKMADTIAKYDNVYKFDADAVKLIDAQPEPQIEAQKYYGEMANVIQKVFTDKNVDLKKALADVDQKLQTEVYDKVKIDQ